LPGLLLFDFEIGHPVDDLVGRESADLRDRLMETIRKHEQESQMRIVG
jgi:hypothetical protein